MRAFLSMGMLPFYQNEATGLTIRTRPGSKWGIYQETVVALFNYYCIISICIYNYFCWCLHISGFLEYRRSIWEIVFHDEILCVWQL
jgi:hypothetical protein